MRPRNHIQTVSETHFFSSLLVREPNFSIRMSERVASMLLPLAGGGDFWGYLSLAPAQHAHLAPDHDWVRGEAEQFAGMLEMLRRPGR
jgi:hypothetical protein